MLKRLIALFLALMMLFVMAGCDDKKEIEINQNEDENSSGEQNPSSDTEENPWDDSSLKFLEEEYEAKIIVNGRDMSSEIYANIIVIKYRHLNPEYSDTIITDTLAKFPLLDVLEALGANITKRNDDIYIVSLHDKKYAVDITRLYLIDITEEEDIGLAINDMKNKDLFFLPTGGSCILEQGYDDIILSQHFLPILGCTADVVFSSRTIYISG